MSSSGPPPPGGFGYPHSPHATSGANDPSAPHEQRVASLGGWGTPGRACGPAPILALFAIGLVRLCVAGIANAPSVPPPLPSPLEEPTIDIEALIGTPEEAADAKDRGDARDVVAADESAVYVGDALARAITIQPKGGGPRAVLTLLPGPLATMAASQSDIYYATTDDGHGGPGSVYRVSKTGGEPEVLATNVYVPEKLAVTAGGAAYLTVSRFALFGPSQGDGLPETGQLLRLGAKTGAESLLARRDARLSDPSALAMDEKDVYFVDHGQGAILAVPRAGGAIRVVTDGIADPTDIAVDDTAVYVTNRAAGEILRVEKRGGKARTIAEGRGRPTALVASGPNLFWVDDLGPTEAAVVRMEKTGGVPLPIAVGHGVPANLVVDGDKLVWSERGVARWIDASAAEGVRPTIHTFREEKFAD